MKNYYLSLIFAYVLPLGANAQGSVAEANEKHPLGQYAELPDPKPHDSNAKWDAIAAPVMLSWGTTDVRYAKHDVPQVKRTNSWKGAAWRGERVNAQAVLWTKTDLKDVKVTLSDLSSAKGVIPSKTLKANFVRYVMTDELNKDGKGGCGCRENKAEWDSSLVADVLDINATLPVKRNSAQPIWVNVSVPRDAAPGVYDGTVTVTADGMAAPQTLRMQLKVLNRTLPEPQKWHLNVDLWQNPYSVARYYGVPLWSKEHFDAMRPIMKMIADAGQWTITASIMHKPWNGQTEDHYDSMVTRIKHIDGSWSYDYAVFDRWVEFMKDDVGINRLICCYTMIPWALNFDYYDEATNRIQFVEAKPGDVEYETYWLNFLKDFARHLKQKGWFDRTAISMDERDMESMLAAIKIIRKADPDFKISFSGNYHEEIQSEIYYLCIPYGHKYPADVLKQRRAKGQISTYYTCCTEPFPGTFSFSNPAEAAWIGIHAVAADYDGYLRWAVNSWTKDPLRDSRFRTWAAGDTYSIYPGPRSSIRFERLVEGLQCAEKITQLRKEYKKNGKTAQLKRLNRAVAEFAPSYDVTEKRDEAAGMVKNLEKLLNE